MSYFSIGGTKVVVGQMSYFIIGGTNVLVGEMSFVIIGGTNVRVGQMSGGTNVSGTNVGGTKVAPPFNLTIVFFKDLLAELNTRSRVGFLNAIPINWEFSFTLVILQLSRF